jgi:hypothetical protein
VNFKALNALLRAREMAARRALADALTSYQTGWLFSVLTVR